MIPANQIRDRIPDLAKALAHLLDQVPAGRVTTYGRLAAALGDVMASRWIGAHLRDHAHTNQCRCHRVVRVDGGLGVYDRGGVGDKANRLRAEGVAIVDGRVALDECLVDTFSGDAPLRSLRDWQTELAGSVRLVKPKRRPRWIAAVDVSYGTRGTSNIQTGTAAYVVWDSHTRQVQFETTCSAAIRFPYVTTYLAFRELPLLVEAFQTGLTQFPRAPDVVLVDGSGILHPRRSGIAAMMGVLLNVPAIGVTKKRLYGQCDRLELEANRTAPVYADDEQLGIAILPTEITTKPLFVSPGHRIDCQMAADVVLSSIADHRLPEPIYWADRLSRQATNRKRHRFTS